MKNKVWIVSPLFLAFPVFMALIAVVAWPNIVVFSMAVAGAVVSLIVYIITAVSNSSRLSALTKSASQELSGESFSALRNFSIPVIVLGDREDIVFSNAAFIKSLSNKKECIGESARKYLGGELAASAFTQEGLSITCQNRKYTVYASKFSKGSILYFIDDTYFKRIAKEYSEKRTITAIVSFDNREEMTSGGGSMEDAQIISRVERVLSDWAIEMGGFIRRLSNNLYLVMTDEIHISNAKEQKFEILDKVRTIKNDQGVSSTVSIGIGRNAASLEEGERWARQALDMALGRGGDQVAIKEKGDSYEFFGGLSKGVERRDKVKTRVIAATINDLIADCENVLIMGHKYADLDSVGAAIGMWTVITKALSKQAFIAINQQQSLAKEMTRYMEEANPDKKIFVSPEEAISIAGKRTILIVVDTQTPEMVECKELLEKCSSVIVIDHHRMMVNHIKEAVIFYHEPFSSSASEMVAEIVQYISSQVINKTEANLLFAGIMLDTKGFIIKSGVRTFEAAAYLRRRGADTVEVKKMFSNTFDSYLSKIEIISKAEIERGYAIACVEETIPEIRIVAAQAADELLNIKDVNASFVLFPNGDEINISARSWGEVNVQIIMEALGGGGHHSMAATQLRDVTMSEAKLKLLSAIQKTRS